MSRYEHAPLYTLSYEVALDLLKRSAALPRPYRPSLGGRMQSASLELLEQITAGLVSSNPRPDVLERADAALMRLRLTLRMCRDLELFSDRQHAHVAERLTEIGRMLGGWRRHQARRLISGPDVDGAPTSDADGRARRPGDSRRRVEQRSQEPAGVVPEQERS